MQRAPQQKSQFSSKQTRNRRTLALGAAVAGAAALVSAASGATVTWVGSIADPNSGTYLTEQNLRNPELGFSDGMPLYLWDTTTANWSGGSSNYTIGDDVVFTDALTSGQVIRVPTSNLNPTTMTFAHVTGGGAVNYNFIATGDFFTAGPTNVSSNTPFGAADNPATTLILDTGFLGKVAFRAQTASDNLNGNVIVRSGILELQENNPLPGTVSRQTTAVELAGGQLNINVTALRGGNFQPGSADVNGPLTVTANSVLELNRKNTQDNGTPIVSSRLWNGPITVGTGNTLTIRANNGVRANMAGNASTSTGTFLVEDGNQQTILQLDSTAGSANATWNLTETSILQTGGNYTFGEITGAATTTLRGSTGASTLSLGAKGTSATFDGVVASQGAGTTSITMVGTGTVTLTNTNTFTGNLTVNAGTLALAGANGAAAGAATGVLNVGGTLRVDNTAAANSDRLKDTMAITGNGGTLAFVGNAAGAAEVVGALNLNQGTTNINAVASAGSSSVTFASLGRANNAAVNFNTAAGVSFNLATAPALQNGIIGGYATANNADWATHSNGGANTISAYAAYTPAGNGAIPNDWVAANNVDVSATSSLALTASGVVNSLKFSGAGANLNLNGANLRVGTGGILAAGTGNPSITGTGSITAGQAVDTAAELFAVVPDASNTLAITAPISNNGTGAVTLVKSGAGTLIIGAGNSYTGGTRILGGGISVGGDNVVTGDLVIDNNTTFNLAGYNQNAIGNVQLINGSAINSGTPGPHGAAATLQGTAYDVRNGTISANLIGAAVLTKTTGGTVTLSGNNTYSGGTNVNAGTLIAGATNAVGTGALVVDGGGTLNIGAFNQSVPSIRVGNAAASAGTVTGSGTITSTSTFNMQNGTVAAVLAGNVGLTKFGAASTVTLSGLNTYTGVTTIDAPANSTLAVNTLKNGGVASSIGASSNAATNLVFNNGGQINYTGTGDSTDRLFTVTAVGAINSGGTGPLAFTNTGTIVDGTGGSTLTLGGGNTAANTFAPRLTGGTIFTKAGGGTWELTNATNNYTGVTSLNGGILRTSVLANGGAASPIGAAPAAATNMSFNGGTLQYAGTGHSTDRLFSFNGNATLDSSGTGAVNFTNTGPLVVNGASRVLTLTGTNGAENTFAPQLSGSAAVTKTGTGTWVMTNANTYVNATTVNAGTLRLTQSQTTNASITASGAGAVLQLVASGGNRVLRSTATGAGAATAVVANNGGKIDLTDNKLITARAAGTFVGTAYTEVAGLVDSARGSAGNALWNGASGITTSDTRAINNGDLLSIGVASVSEARGLDSTVTTTFMGQTVLGSDTIAMVTWGGDATLDGKINIDDYGQIDSNVSKSGTVFGWNKGDFNYDGKINIDDYGIIDGNIGRQTGTLPTAGGVGEIAGGSALDGVAAVPEPASLSLVALSAMGLLRRRRRTH